MSSGRTGRERDALELIELLAARAARVLPDRDRAFPRLEHVDPVTKVAKPARRPRALNQVFYREDEELEQQINRVAERLSLEVGPGVADGGVLVLHQTTPFGHSELARNRPMHNSPGLVPVKNLF